VNEYIDALLAFQFDDFFALVGQVIDNPLANVQASLMLLITLVVVTLLAVVVAILIIGFGDDSDAPRAPAGKRRTAGKSAASTPAARKAARAAEKADRAPLTAEARRRRLAGTTATVMVSLLAAWLLAGVTTGAETMCLSCHGGDMPHTERLVDEGSTDPHRSTNCVRCHEPGGVVGSLTYSVPSRVAHFAQGIAGAEAVAGYGVPVASDACERCHAADVRGTVTVEDRGVKISHAEPLEAGAVCVDCHEVQKATGVVGTFTVGMAPCLRCHDNEQASAACEYCHTKDIAYAVHVNIEAQPKVLVPDKRCGSCHDQTSCDACHGLRMPHSPEFIATEHPRAATLDIWDNNGETCKKCHTQTRNPCTACHRKLGPGHPPEAWRTIHGLGGPEVGFNRAACNGCHGYLAPIEGRNFCGVCHKEYVGYQQAGS